MAAGRATADRWAHSAAHKRARIGFDYVHSVVDDYSRLAYSEILPDEKGATGPCGSCLTLEWSSASSGSELLGKAWLARASEFIKNRPRGVGSGRKVSR